MRGYGRRPSLIRPLVGQLGASNPGSDMVIVPMGDPVSPSFGAWQKDIAFAVDEKSVRAMLGRIASDASLNGAEKATLVALAEARAIDLSTPMLARTSTWVVGGLALGAFLLLRKSRTSFAY